MFRGLDYALDEARKRGIRMIISFVDNWSAVGGVDQYINWSSTAKTHDDFFSDHQTKRMYKNHVQAVIHRVNTINGRVYRDDPTIMAWNM